MGRPRKRISTNCKQCGKTFESVPSANRVFCCWDCHSLYKRNHPEISPLYNNGRSKVKVICSNCSKKITKKQANINRSRNLFCNTRCHNEWQRKNPKTGVDHHQYKRVKISCEICDTVKEKWPSHVKKYTHQFCSNKCRKKWMQITRQNSGENNPAWRGGYEPYYGSNWQQQRRKARERDNKTCQNCKKHEDEFSEELHVHHIIPFRSFNGNYNKANKLSNLTCLCRTCHTTLEWKTA